MGGCTKLSGHRTTVYQQRVQGSAMLKLLCPAAIVGRLGAAPLGAVGLSNLVFFFCQAFFGFLLIVTTPRVANAVAGGDKAEVA